MRAEGGTDGKAALALARDHAHLFAHVPLHGGGDEVFILPEGVAAGVVAAVISPAQIRKAAPDRVSVQNAAVIAHRRPHIGGRAHAAFYLQRIHARAQQLFDVFPHTEVRKGEAVSGRVEAAAVDGIPLTAGLLAQPAVAAVAADDGGKITLPRKAGAQCPLHEAFRLHLRGDGGDVGKGRLAGEDDARKAAALCQPRPVHVAHPRLGGEVQLHRRVRLFEELAQKDVLQDERVGARVPCPQGTGKERLQLAVFDQRVEGDVHFGAQNVGARGIIRQVFEREIRGGLAGGKILQAQIDRVCARAQRRFECGGVARRRQNFCHRHPPNLNTKAYRIRPKTHFFPLLHSTMPRIYRRKTPYAAPLRLCGAAAAGAGYRFSSPHGGEGARQPRRARCFYWILEMYSSAVSTQPSMPTMPLSKQRWWFSAMPHFWSV